MSLTTQNTSVITEAFIATCQAHQLSAEQTMDALGKAMFGALLAHDKQSATVTVEGTDTCHVALDNAVKVSA